MQNRRKFLADTTLAAGALVFLKPLKFVTLSPSNSLNGGDKLSILNLHTFENLSHIALLPSAMGKFQKFISNNNYNTLLLSTGNIVDSKGTSKPYSIETLKLLRKSGCDAMVYCRQNLASNIIYNQELATENKPTSLSETTYYVTSNHLLPYRVVSKGNIKIGIIGNSLLNQKGCTKNSLEEMALRLNKTADFLKTETNCHLVVSMNPYYNGNKCSKKEEKALAALTKNIDVIVSSNSASKHATAYVVKNVQREDVILNYPDAESGHSKRIDISFNNKLEKISLSLRKAV